MAARAYWKGYLKLSLVSCPIALFPATTEREKISFHQLNKETGNRIRYRKVDAESGGVPDGDVGQQAFAVIRDAIRKEGMVALGKVVFTTREHIIALEARDNGIVGTTLRYPYEVRQAKDYFDVIEDEKVPKDMLDLAVHIVESKKGEFEPEKFEDEYETALKELLRKKQKGERIERPKEPSRTNVVNLMDALRQSVKAESSTARRKISGSAERRAQKKPARAAARQRKAG